MFKFINQLIGRSPRAETAAASNENAMRALLGLDDADGITVNDSTALRVSTVYACLARLAGAMLQLPIHQYVIDDSGNRKRAPLAPLWWLLNESPHEDWTAASWKEWIMHCVALRGDQHTEILRGPGGTIRGLQPLHPDHVAPRRIDGRLVYRVFDAIKREHYMVAREDMLHFCGYGFNGVHSLSVIQWAARQAVRNAIVSSDHARESLANGAVQKLALLYPNKINQGQLELLRESWSETYGGAKKSGRPIVLTEGGQIKELSLSASDLQLIEGRKFEREEICQAFGVPPVLIGDTEKASSWGTGIEQITLGFVNFTLKPHLVRWEEELNRKLFKRAGQFVEFELDGLLRGDSKAQADAFRIALGGPGTGDAYMTVNEVRRLKNLPPMDGAENDRLFKASTATTAAPSGKP
ncbi:phage portal protein [Piscinibacter sp.]|uniref:phage portal protein n=1 Tax=Piscinibacter sp. TaxID=1903157 RepID=UPI0035ADBA29